VAGQTPLGLGLAYGLKYQGKKGSCLCYLGDGAVNQGAFHESLNLAELFDIPVIYVIENNGYSMGTSQARSSAHGECLAKRAEAYGMAWDVIDGSNLYEVRAKTHVAMERAHHESRPTLLEIDTYRYYGHSIADANHKKYRTPEEIENYKQNHDPINVFRRKLVAEGVITEEQAAEITRAASDEANAAVKFADESPAPTIADIGTDVYWESDNATPAAAIGRHFFNP
ncbi:MAG TPA: thiamine pyrophosphate-dependent enzyme, partial [Luteolibacter sp.]|nr:thiamine pyrophosphate-dependent enzyme [Luteolibacter sp.]